MKFCCCCLTYFLRVSLKRESLGAISRSVQNRMLKVSYLLSRDFLDGVANKIVAESRSLIFYFRFTLQPKLQKINSTAEAEMEAFLAWNVVMALEK